MKMFHLWSAFLLLTLCQAVTAAEGLLVDESRQINANEKIVIDVMRGKVTVRGSASTTFRVRGRLDELAEGFELNSASGFTRFEVKMPRFNNRRADEGSDLEFEVPAGADIQINGINTAVDISDLSGASTEISSVNGHIDASNLNGLIEISTVNGRISSSDNRGKIELSTVNGQIDDRQSEGRLSFSAINGSINVDSTAQEARLSVVNGEVEARLQGIEDLQFSTVNGPVSLTLTDSVEPRIKGSSVSATIVLNLDTDISARFSIRSNAGGTIINGLTEDPVVRAEYGPARSLQFSVGEGAGIVELNSVSGRIEIR